MAEETEKQAASKKRRLRTNTETIRERSERQQKQGEPSNRSVNANAFKSGFTWPVRMAVRPIRALGKYKIFRFFGYILLPKYVRNSWRELRQVVWPDRKQTLRLTFAVFVFSVAFGLIVALVDFVLNKIFKEIILS